MCVFDTLQSVFLVSASLIYVSFWAYALSFSISVSLDLNLLMEEEEEYGSPCVPVLLYGHSFVVIS